MRVFDGVMAAIVCAALGFFGWIALHEPAKAAPAGGSGGFVVPASASTSPPVMFNRTATQTQLSKAVEPLTLSPSGGPVRPGADSGEWRRSEPEAASIQPDYIQVPNDAALTTGMGVDSVNKRRFFLCAKEVPEVAFYQAIGRWYWNREIEKAPLCPGWKP